MVGAGAGGGTVAGVLAEAGARALLVEHSPAYRNEEPRGDHLHGKRVSVYAGNAGPGAGNPRLFERADGTVARLCGEFGGQGGVVGF
ncbi:hypothetical protein [Streptomyces sp. NBC_01235]|uniref:hypothetical protein n=1 Tax=Streptomyces sp. NBC_01235 TaxID=2903788 RepID=UPI002E0F04E3|nr:hypothetical protein OG289_32570 [Streptomyces sp. NBC_01235]